ncbi:MAG: Rrf2 family transcriptional regulator [Planctomycetota bacterium]|nr:Rrf2 family transcriptional regulator [Planctomycetota bacterium]
MNPISQSSEHMIRALTFLAQHHGKGYFLAREMGAELGIPAPYLAKLLRPLVGRGVLESQRGRGGGFRLAVAPEKLTLLDIVDAQENLTGSRRCFLGQAECSDDRACPVHDTWKVASEHLVQRLMRTTLADTAQFCEERPESGYPGPTPGAPHPVAPPHQGGDAQRG